MIFAAYLAVLTVGTAALLLPIARVGEGGASLLVAAFTATSVVSVTGSPPSTPRRTGPDSGTR